VAAAASDGGEARWAGAACGLAAGPAQLVGQVALRAGGAGRLLAGP
jgi:hypothetical protein